MHFTFSTPALVFASVKVLRTNLVFLCVFVLGHIASAPKYRSIEGIRRVFIIAQLVLIDKLCESQKYK